VVIEIDFQVIDWSAWVRESCRLLPHDGVLTDGAGDPIQPVGGKEGTFTVASGAEHLHPYLLPPPPEPQGGDMAQPLVFSVRVEAHDAAHNLVTTYNGPAALSSSTGTIWPPEVVLWGGVWQGPAAIYADLDPPTTISATDGVTAPFPSNTFMLCGKGDPTGDGEVNIFDVIRTVNITLAKPVPDFPRYEFQFWAADISRDGTVNVIDVIRIVNKALGRTAALGAAAMGATAPSVGPVEVTVAPARGGAWAIRVSNAAGLAGAQFEIACKQGEVAAGELAAAAGWQVQSNWVNGRLRVIAYSPSAIGLTVGEGTLLRLTNIRGKPRLASVLLSDAKGSAISSR
jgi:hypothetical protein